MLTADEFKRYKRSMIEAFRANEGRISGWDSLFLLTTNGAKSGKPHTTPLVYSMDGDRIIVLAAAAGTPKHPVWYHNQFADLVVQVEHEGKTYRMQALEADGEEYQHLFKQHAAKVPVVLEYQEQTKRRIPIIILEQRD